MHGVTLAVDTAYAQCGLALAVDGKRYTATHRAQSTTELFLPALDDLLMQAGAPRRAIKTIVWNVGPGSFTGLRLASAIVQGLVFAAPQPIHIVPLDTFSLLRMAIAPRLAQINAEALIMATDARADEVYAHALRLMPNADIPLCAIQVAKPDALAAEINAALNQNRRINPHNIALCGEGFNVYPELMGFFPNAHLLPEPTLEERLSALLSFADDQANTHPPRARYNDEFNPEGRADLPLYVRHRIAKTLEEQTAWKQRFTQIKEKMM